MHRKTHIANVTNKIRETGQSLFLSLPAFLKLSSPCFPPPAPPCLLSKVLTKTAELHMGIKKSIFSPHPSRTSYVSCQESKLQLTISFIVIPLATAFYKHFSHLFSITLRMHMACIIKPSWHIFHIIFYCCYCPFILSLWLSKLFLFCVPLQIILSVILPRTCWVSFICLFSFTHSCNSSVLSSLCTPTSNLCFFPPFRYFLSPLFVFFSRSILCHSAYLSQPSTLIRSPPVFVFASCVLPAHSILSLLQAEMSIKLQVNAAPWQRQQFPWQQ